jgi:Xaa-Pro aminopeptidase
MGELFKHGLGHGVGLNVHEEPRVSSRSTDVLTVGMVVTIEPGVYVPDMGGVRIEDTVLIAETGIEVLSECDRGLAELG